MSLFLRCGPNHRLDLSTPVVMGVLNVTPDSFSDGGKYEAADAKKNEAGMLTVTLPFAQRPRRGARVAIAVRGAS